MDDWRRNNTFALLVAPLYQFPQKSSQIYSQAVERNVTLLSYAHLRFLLRHAQGKPIVPLLERKSPSSNNSSNYWSQLDFTILEITQAKEETLQQFKDEDKNYAIEIGKQAIQYWQKHIESYQRLTHAQAVEKLIQSQKIPQRIQSIKHTLRAIGSTT